MPKSKTVNLYEAKTQLSKLVDEAAAGAEVVIAKAGTAKARLVPLEKARPPGAPGAGRAASGSPTTSTTSYRRRCWQASWEGRTT